MFLGRLDFLTASFHGWLASAVNTVG